VKAILFAIASRLNSDGWAWPSIDTLAGDAGAHRATVVETLAWLRKTGIVVVDPHGDHRAATVCIDVNALASLDQDVSRTSGNRKVVRARRSSPTTMASSPTTTGACGTTTGSSPTTTVDTAPTTSQSSPTACGVVPDDGDGRPRRPKGINEQDMNKTITDNGPVVVEADPTVTQPSPDRKQPTNSEQPVLFALELVEPAPKDNAVQRIWEAYVEARLVAIKGSRRPVLDDKRKKLIRDALKTFSVDDLVAACRGVFRSEWHMSNDHATIESALKNTANIERFMHEPPIAKRGGHTSISQPVIESNTPAYRPLPPTDEDEEARLRARKAHDARMLRELNG
jgi:hypothetical protein